MLRTAVAAAALALGTGGAIAQGDVAQGKEMFEFRCGTCHTVGEGIKNGPDDVANVIAYLSTFSPPAAQ